MIDLEMEREGEEEVAPNVQLVCTALAKLVADLPNQEVTFTQQQFDGVNGAILRCFRRVNSDTIRIAVVRQGKLLDLTAEEYKREETT